MVRSLTRTPLASPGRALVTTLSAFRFGAADLTTRLHTSASGVHLWRATHTPEGPGTVHARWAGDAAAEVESWGPGGGWLAGTTAALSGAHDHGHTFTAAHPAILAAQRHHPHLRLGRSGTLYHELLPVIIAQRVTAGEAIRSWRRLVERLGEPAPGPHPELRLPPAPEVLAARPAWWFHPLGIEAKRAEALRTVARHARLLWGWAALDPAPCATRLALLRGVGVWTIGSVLGPALGDPDAVPVGDHHLKNAVAWTLDGQPRGTDERMLELLEPYRGQRGRVVRLLLLSAGHAPKFGPRQRILPMHRW